MADGLIIVGASLAGAKAAEGAREAGWTGPIRLIGAEQRLPYERPPLSKDLLLGKDEPDVADVHPAAYYTDNEIDLVLGSSATELDLDARTVTLENGTRFEFDKLVLATGSSPRTLPIPGADLDGVRLLRTIDDSLALREALVPGARLVTVGASWIGTEVSAVARQRGAEVVMVDPLSLPLERVLGVEVGQYFADLHRSQGAELRMGVGVDAIVGNGTASVVVLSDGVEVPADVVVIGVGVTPNIELAKHAGIDTDTGVLVNGSLQASHPDVYAAGDIAEQLHPVADRRIRVEHWANAQNQGLAAGRNAVGAAETYDRVPYFFSDQYATGMEYSGWPLAWDSVRFRGNPADGAFVAFYLSAGRVVGGANINVWDVNEHVQRLVRSGAEVDVARLTDENVDPEDW